MYLPQKPPCIPRILPPKICSCWFSLVVTIHTAGKLPDDRSGKNGGATKSSLTHKFLDHCAQDSKKSAIISKSFEYKWAPDENARAPALKT